MAWLTRIYQRVKHRLFHRIAVDRAPVSQTGNWGEAIATDYLITHRYKVLGRNIRPNRHGELDIIAQDKDLDLHFIEVKTRSSDRYGRPIDAVNNKKRLQMRKAATAWLLKNHAIDRHYQFDVIEIIGNPHSPQAPQITHIQAIDMSMTRAPYERI